MLGRFRNSFAEINLQNLEHNFRLLQNLVKGKGLAPMVKANGYGHGDIQTAKVCERLGARFLGVSLIEEGIKLRMAGIQTPILVFGFFDAVGADALIKYRLTPVLSSFDQIEKLKSALNEEASYPVHLKFNTGMQRLGFDPDQSTKLAQEFELESFLKLEGICTHFVYTNNFSEQQNVFSEVKKVIKSKVQSPLLTHISNSAAILSGVISDYDVFRPGISLYGVLPTVMDFQLQPVLSLRSQIALLRQVKKDSVVSYGGTWKASKNSTVAVVPLGYADGIPRALSNKGKVLIGGQLCPIIGIVTMDYFMVDVSALQNPSIGDEVVVIGKQKEQEITANELADLTGTITYEILTGIQERVPRIYIH